MTLLCKKCIVAKSKEVETGSNLAESSKECYGSERAVLPMMAMIIIVVKGKLVKHDAMKTYGGVEV
jgi:hypothetical protein